MKNIIKLKKGIIKLSYKCNNKCLFCWAEKYEDRIRNNIVEDKIILKKIIEAKKLKLDMVVFTGGEPTIDKKLFKFMKFATINELKIGIATNGRLFSNKLFCKKIFYYEPLFIHFSFQGYDSESYKRITNVDGYNQVIKGLENISKEKCLIIVNIVVNNDNINKLNEMIDILIRYNIKYIRLSLMEPIGPVLKNLDILPDIIKASEKINKALDYGIGKRINIYFDGVPFCLIKDNNDKYLFLYGMGIDYISEAFEDRFFKVEYDSRTKENCKDCKNLSCPGIYKGYINLSKNKILKILEAKKFK